jgi:hypothetical protein
VVKTKVLAYSVGAASSRRRAADVPVVAAANLTTSGRPVNPRAFGPLLLNCAPRYLATHPAPAGIATVTWSLEEFFTDEHAALLVKVLARIHRLSADIDDLSQVIERLLAPYEEQLQQAESMPGWQRRAAQDAVAETGVDMTRFRTGAHLVSWAGRAPHDHQSGKRKGRATAKKGNRTWAPSPARPPWQPAAPRPAKALATCGWPAGAAPPRHASPPATPS